MNVLITGGTGFLGCHLIEAAQKSGWQVTVLSRTRPDLTSVKSYRGDLVSPGTQISEAFKNQDLILHAAVDYHSPQRTFAMTENVLTLAASSGNAKIVFISSQNASFKNPRGYSLAKRQSEDLLKARYSNWCIVRPTLIYDDGGGFFIGDLIRAARKFRVIPIPGSKTAQIQPVHAEDVARLIIQAVELPQGTTWTIAGQEAITLKELAKQIQRNLPGTSIFSIPMGPLKLLGKLIPALGEKITELEQVKTLSREEDKQLLSILGGRRRSILEDLPKLIGSTGGDQTKIDVLRNPRVGIKE